MIKHLKHVQEVNQNRKQFLHAYSTCFEATNNAFNILHGKQYILVNMHLQKDLTSTRRKNGSCDMVND